LCPGQVAMADRREEARKACQAGGREEERGRQQVKGSRYRSRSQFSPPSEQGNFSRCCIASSCASTQNGPNAELAFHFILGTSPPESFLYPFLLFKHYNHSKVRCRPLGFLGMRFVESREQGPCATKN
jgi:hypothetical protein